MEKKECCHSKTPSHSTFEKDPICGMDVAPERAAGKFLFENKTYYFCSRHCLTKFSENPSRYLKKPETSSPPIDLQSIYTCPMHLEISQRGPGSCPLCGMALEPKAPSLDDKPSPELEDFTRRFTVGLIFAVPLFFLSMVEMMPLSIHFTGQSINSIQLLLASPVVLWSGFPIFQKGWNSLRQKNLNMFTLIAFGTAIAYLFSIAATLFPELFPRAFLSHGNQLGVYFEAAATIIELVLLGQILELRARSQTGAAIQALLKLSPKTARKVTPQGEELDVSLSEIQRDDNVRVRPGETIPVDGILINGNGIVDESMLTGEPIPVDKNIGQIINAGTLNVTGSFVMKATGVGNETVLSQIITMVVEAQRSRAPIQRLADKVSGYFVPTVILIACLTAIVWAFFGPEPRYTYAIVNAIAVLIIACPCALGLATPMSILVGTGRGAQVGVLIRDAEALELLEKVDTLVVDKTGTLTEGKPSLDSIQSFNGFSEREVLTFAISLEKGSEHPLGAAILEGGKIRGLESPLEVSDFLALAGLGVKGKVSDKMMTLGNEKLLEAEGVSTEPILSLSNTFRAKGQTVLYLCVEKTLAGVFGISDRIKSSTPEAIQQLKQLGIKITMLTGDHIDSAQSVAHQLGIDEVIAGVLPDQKRATIRRLRQNKRIVAMAGDGVNDAPALAEAHVGIAMGTGTDVAMKSAGLTLVKGDLRGIVKARNLSRATLKNIRQNLFFAFAYNALGVPIAAGVLYPYFGILLSPIFASAAMSLSSVSVIANSLRLQKVNLNRPT